MQALSPRRRSGHPCSHHHYGLDRCVHTSLVEGWDFSFLPLGGQYEITGDHLYHVAVETLDAHDNTDCTSLYDYDSPTPFEVF